MLSLVIGACTVWVALLTVVLAVAAARAGEALERVLWLDTAALTLIALLALIALGRASAPYLDAALALALLAFLGTVALTRYLRRGGPG